MKIPKFLFFPPSDAKIQEGTVTLANGGFFTDPDAMIRTPEFKAHLREVRAVEQSYGGATPGSPSTSDRDR